MATSDTAHFQDAARSASLRFQLITNESALAALAPAWQDLLQQAASPEPMLSPTWLLPWWRLYGKGHGRELRLGLFFAGETLVGLAPMYRRWRRPRFGLPFRRLELLGVDADQPDGVCSDYLNLVVRRDCERAVVQAFGWELLHGGFGPWDECVFSAMAGDNPLTAMLQEAFAEWDRPAELTPLEGAPYLTLPASWEEYLRRLKSKSRRLITTSLREFEEWSQGDYQLHQASTLEELAHGRHILHSLHAERWDGAGRAGVFQSSRFTAFHDACMPALLEAGQLQLQWLTLRGEPVAAMYSIVANNKVYYYQCGRKLDVPAKARVGIVLLALAIRGAIAAGRREFDFLTGLAQYKLQLTETVRPLLELRIAPSSLPQLIQQFSKPGLALARQVRQWVRRHFRKG